VSSGEGEVERGATLQAGSLADGCRPKCHRAEGGPPTGSSGKLLPTQVASDREGRGIPPYA
jgi:hypothetical protein